MDRRQASGSEPVTDEPVPGYLLFLAEMQGIVKDPHKPSWKHLCPTHPERLGKEDTEPSFSLDYKRNRWGELTLLGRCYPCGSNLHDACRAVGLSTARVLLHNEVLASELRAEPYVAPLPSLRRLVAWNRALRDDPERLAYMDEQRGLTLKTINRYWIGHDGSRYTLPVFTHGHKGRLVNLRRYLPDPPNGERKMLGKKGRGIQFYPDVPPSDGWLLLCEGEWDALLARQHDLPAFTSTGGIDGWEADWNPAFAGRLVAICFDCDASGRRAAAARAEELCAAGAVVKVVDLDLGDKEDLTDWFVHYGRTAAELTSHIKSTPFTGNEAPSVRRLRVATERTEGKKKAPAALTAPGLSRSPKARRYGVDH